MLNHRLANFTRSQLTKTTTRSFASVPADCMDHLKKLGIKNKNIVYNPT